MLQLRSVIRVITLITLPCCFDEEGHSLCSKRDIPYVRRRTFLVFEEWHSLGSKKDIPCVRGRTFLVCEERHSLCSKQDNPCVRGRTFLVLRRGHFVCSTHQQSTCHFLVNSADRPGIIPDWGGLWSESRDDRLNSPKSGGSASNGQKLARIAPILTIFGRNRSRRPKLFF